MHILSTRRFWVGITLVGHLACTGGLAAQAAQTTSSKTIRIGDVAARLTDQEVADVEKALPAGGKPWLLIGVTPFEPGIQTIGAYMLPTTNLPELRRGQIITVGRQVIPLPPTSWSTTSWVISNPAHEYAQVAFGGRNFDQITDAKDINLPFAVTGVISDADLIGVVKSVRSTGYGGLQIMRLGVWDDQPSNVLVSVRGGGPGTGGGANMALTLQKQGQTWGVISAFPAPIA